MATAPTEVLTADLPESPTMRHGASSHWRSPEKCLLESVPSDRTLTALRQLPMPARWCCTTQTWKACATARSPASSVYRSGRSCHASIAHASAFATYSPPQDSPHPPTCHATQRAWSDATPTREICFGDLRRTCREWRFIRLHRRGRRRVRPPAAVIRAAGTRWHRSREHQARPLRTVPSGACAGTEPTG
jgi:hypothetical protein